MSKIDYCPVGGQEGIMVDEWEQEMFAKYMETEWRDEYIPLPGIGPDVQKDIIEGCTYHDPKMATIGPTIYWENDKGSHGWCCVQCGRVQQWG